MSGGGLLAPGAHRASGVVDDAALVRAMLHVEVAWLAALASVGAASPEDANRVAAVVDRLEIDLEAMGREGEDTGNPVVPLVRRLRAACDEPLAALVHRGLTSQDVLDTALVLVAEEALARVENDLRGTATAVGVLAARHRDTVMVGRTLTQWAVPVTFGLKAAQWLVGVLDAADEIRAVRRGLPVQCGGAAGTLALTAHIAGDPLAVAGALADELGLVLPDLPWHTRRRPVTRIGDALVAACDSLGAIATDVALLSRPEVAEVREGVVAGRGGSSTMPQKRNPVLSVLVRSAALQAPLLGAQLHTAAALAVDERPDGAWHSEWPGLQRLLGLALTAASQAAELTAGLEVDAGAMERRARGASADLLAERGGGSDGDPADYLGAAGRLVDAALARLERPDA